MLLTIEIILKRQTRTKTTKLQFTKWKKSKRSLKNCFQTHFQLDLRIISLTKEDLINKQKSENVRASLVAKTVKNPPAMQETWAQSLHEEDPPGGGHGNPLQCPCLENPHGHRSLAGCSPWGRKELDMTE